MCNIPEGTNPKDFADIIDMELDFTIYDLQTEEQLILPFPPKNDNVFRCDPAKKGAPVGNPTL